MFSLALWLVGPILESALLLRALQTGSLRRYKCFYLYVTWVLVRDLSLFPIYRFRADYYVSVYWYSQFVSVLLGCGIVWEVYKLTLSRYPGMARMARNVLAFVFILSASRIFANAWNDTNWMPVKTAFDAERDLRVVQITVLLGLIVLLAYYAVPTGRNLRGIILGYAAFLATSVSHLSLRTSLGHAFPEFWQYLQPAAYISVLLVWCGSLWHWAPVPESDAPTGLEEDYQSLLAATRRRLAAAGDYVERSVRP
ncbi:MAG TPA: hypothetical protein VFO40_27295 [Chthoniobacterales bacterium]|nr:hypothetical protein [Chthoniobacterales bacterium]